MSGALQPFGEFLPARRAAQLAPTSRFRSGAAVQLAAGAVSAFFALEAYDRRRGVATYALRVINRTKSALVCRTWVLTDAGESVLAYPTFFEVEPFSTSETLVPLWPGDFSPFDRAVAEVVGDGVHCVVEAAAPPVRQPFRIDRWIAALGLAALVVIAGIGVRAAMPRIAAFAVPPEALAGTTVQAEYSAFGSGRLSYFVLAPDGRRLQGGRLDDRSGSISIALPPASEPGAYTLQMAMTGPLGSVSETRVLNALSSHQAAQINDISVHPLVARPGQSVDVAYSAAADDGYVRLIGSDGSIWAQAPFSKNGETRLVMPPVPDAREMRIVLHVTKGSSTAQSVAGILVTNGLNPAPAGSAAVAAGDDPAIGTVTGSDANGTFEVTERTVKSGNPITVKILSPRNGMRIALTDAQSHEVTGSDVGPDADVVTLRAPSVLAPTQYTVVATFTDGFGQESIVQAVTVLP